MIGNNNSANDKSPLHFKLFNDENVTLNNNTEPDNITFDVLTFESNDQNQKLKGKIENEMSKFESDEKSNQRIIQNENYNDLLELMDNAM